MVGTRFSAFFLVEYIYYKIVRLCNIKQTTKNKIGIKIGIRKERLYGKYIKN